MKIWKHLLSGLLCFILTTSLGMTQPTTVSASSANYRPSADKTYINSKTLQNYYSSNRKNKEPIIMVHGLFGWGGNEVLGIHYWGGLDSLSDELTKKGYDVYTPSVGPVSSVWDRACELYAYIVGGTVDYGKAHSEHFGHARYGRTFPGICPELLTSDAHKIHLLGHSMGGETIRALAALLEVGNETEQSATKEDTSPLFLGGHHWIRSITTLCTPHDGSAFSEVCTQYDPDFHNIFAALATQTGSNLNALKLDFKLDQWGLKQQPNESYESYYKRVSESKIWTKTKDIANYDLSIEGAKEVNQWAKAQDDIYYFSVACSDTHKDSKSEYQVANAHMNPLFLSSAKIIGSYTENRPGKVFVDSSWWENDGLVSIRSAIAPHEGSTDTWRTFDGQMIKGTWNYLGLVENTDHLEVVWQSRLNTRNELIKLYTNIGNMLYSL